MCNNIRVSEESIAHSGMLEHSSGFCANSFIPKGLEKKVNKNLDKSTPALISLIKNCRKAEEWAMSSTGTIVNKKYNLSVYSIYGEYLKEVRDYFKNKRKYKIDWKKLVENGCKIIRTLIDILFCRNVEGY